jgi:Thioredoxin
MKFLPIIFTSVILYCNLCLANSREYYTGVLALVAVIHTETVEPIQCQCNGSGRSGDGLSVCQCGADCKCLSKTERSNLLDIKTDNTLQKASSKTQILFFSTSNCPPCEMVKSEFRKMKKTGWKIGQKDDDHIIKSTESGRYNVTSFPCFIRLVNGVEVSRSYGYRNSYSILDFYNGVTQ